VWAPDAARQPGGGVIPNPIVTPPKINQVASPVCVVYFTSRHQTKIFLNRTSCLSVVYDLYAQSWGDRGGRTNREWLRKPSDPAYSKESGESAGVRGPCPPIRIKKQRTHPFKTESGRTTVPMILTPFFGSYFPPMANATMGRGVWPTGSLNYTSKKKAGRQPRDNPTYKKNQKELSNGIFWYPFLDVKYA